MLKLNDIKSPTLEVELPDGSTKAYNLHDLARRLHKANQRDDGDLDAKYDDLRGVFEFPTEAEAAKSESFTLTPAQCEHLHVTVLEKLDNLPDRKRFFSLLQKWQNTSASTPSNSRG